MAGKNVEVLSFEQTGKALGYSRRSWSRHWKTYVKERGFPAPIPSVTTLRRPRWNMAAVSDWLHGLTTANIAPHQADRDEQAFAARMQNYAG